jgi:uncharacterized protein (TIGR02118 family)
MMSAVKAVVLYPHPFDREEFNRRYREEHIPICQQFANMTQMVMTPILGGPRGKAEFYKLVEMHFPSLEALQADFGTEVGRQSAVHAAELSTGGAPTILICGADEVVIG